MTDEILCEEARQSLHRLLTTCQHYELPVHIRTCYHTDHCTVDLRSDVPLSLPERELLGMIAASCGLYWGGWRGRPMQVWYPCHHRSP